VKSADALRAHSANHAAKASPENRPRTVDCPACGRAAEFSPANPWRPFCSERCKKIDLGAWASEQYRIGGQQSDGDDLQDHDPV